MKMYAPVIVKKGPCETVNRSPLALYIRRSTKYRRGTHSSTLAEDGPLLFFYLVLFQCGGHLPPSSAYIYPLQATLERSCEKLPHRYSDSGMGSNLLQEWRKPCERRGLTSSLRLPQHLPAPGVLALILVFPSTTPVFTVSAIPLSVTIIIGCIGCLACTTSPS